MKITDVKLDTVCGVTSKLPEHDIPEVAFWGRSNVGKSSLLNRLWGRKGLARTSSEPGKTQTINYYLTEIRIKNEVQADDLDEIQSDPISAKNTEPAVDRLCSLYMVDLPGYGYAKTSRENTKKWMTMIRKYLESSKALRMVCLLIDSRRPPSELDMEQFKMLYLLGFNPLIIATKTDKLKKNEKKKCIKAIQTAFNKEISLLQSNDNASQESDITPDDTEIPVIAFSSTTGEGTREIDEYLRLIL